VHLVFGDKGDARKLAATLVIAKVGPFKCSGCDSHDVSLWLFAVRAEADGWAEESGPEF
jgi:hypothetical protein